MAHVEPIKTNGRAYNVSPAVFLAMPGFRQMHITFEYLGQSINFISQRSLFLISTDSFSLHQLKQQTAWQKSY